MIGRTESLRASVMSMLLSIRRPEPTTDNRQHRFAYALE
jgi:hypothetical protein